ncbi:hypothetical protein [Caenimonas aquaedulcis]|uniref:Uncharacterized protein n=1 Tax=Caenimonas aquaedulcis TaxID=2793270 RepID=A0A931H382_9BURK|nr:hypothetical protein [Caenimonas aquaedulcis]MBG9387719.1 hypothetical protein [Caenimonas aquaedulcis]
MKGYYTVKLVGGDLAGRLRIELETRYARALEGLLGGPEQVKDVCLAAAAHARSNAPADPRLRAACLSAEAVAWHGRARCEGARFELNAWEAVDLA